MPPTLKQLAAYTGLSVPTVSEILNNKQRLYRADTRQRVLDAARQMGYRPNGSARSMKSGRFGIVALLQRAGCHTVSQVGSRTEVGRRVAERPIVPR